MKLVPLLINYRMADKDIVLGSELNINLVDEENENLVVVKDNTTKLVKSLEERLDKIYQFLTNFKDFPEFPSLPSIPEYPKEITIKNPVKTVKVENLKDIKVPEFPKIPDLSFLKKELVDLKQTVAKIRLPKEAKEAIAVRLSDGEKFYKAIEYLVAGGGGGGYKEVNATVRETIPTDSTKMNPSLVLFYTGSNLTKIEKTIGAIIYTKTLTYDGSNNLIGVSVWS